MRDVDCYMRAIRKREHNEYAIEAAFHGIKIPTIEHEDNKVDFTQEQSVNLDKAMLEAQKRKMSERG